jgi:hypothetical protein
LLYILQRTSHFFTIISSFKIIVVNKIYETYFLTHFNIKLIPEKTKDQQHHVIGKMIDNFLPPSRINSLKQFHGSISSCVVDLLTANMLLFTAGAGAATSNSDVTMEFTFMFITFEGGHVASQFFLQIVN